MRLALLLLIVPAVLAGCTQPEELGYGAYYAARVTGASGCTVHLPWPLDGDKPWAAPPVSHNGTAAEVVTTDHGRALRMSGAGTLAVNTSESGREPINHNLSMNQQAYASDGTREVGTHWVKADACAGATLDLAWVFDDEPRGWNYAASQALVDGWQELMVVRTPL